jgi:multidrug efflux pump subunit AcrA (membrane-fusion protein)
MSARRRVILRITLLIVPILIGAFVFFTLVKNKQGPPKRPRLTNVRKVRIIEVVKTDVIPKTHGYGIVRPTTTWKAISEVSGKVAYINPLLQKGQRVSKGTLLLEIDPTDYKLSITEARASLRSIEAQFKQLQDKETSTNELLKLELYTLNLKQNELNRQKKLVSTAIATKSDYDQAEGTYIAQKYKVQALRNALNSTSSENELLKAQEEQGRVKLQSALNKLEDTKIVAPFDCLISLVNAEKSQFIQAGQSFAELENLDSVEIEAQISNGLHVFRPQQNQNRQEQALGDAESLGDAFGIKAIVKPTTGKLRSEWQGTVMRFNAEIDSKTRTPGVIIQVDDPFSLGSKLPRRPLIKGMYCEVELYGKPFRDQLIIPRIALHENNIVYILDEEDKLRFRKVETLFSQDSFTVIDSGLLAGDRVVLTDVVPAVEGMSVDPVIDEKSILMIRAEAMGGSK